MRSYLFIIVGILSFLVTFFLIFSPNISNRSQIGKVGKELSIEKTENITAEWMRMVYKYLKFPLDNHYGSHAIVLLAALFVLKSGPILELGMGSTSTPLLHRLSSEQKRFVLSADSDLRWINYFSDFTINNTLHELKYVEVKTEMGIEWATSSLINYKNWSVVFIDHRPGPRRQFDLMFYAYQSTIVVLHDTEQSSLYRYNNGLKLYRYQYRFTKLKTYTDVLSTTNETLIERIRYLLESTPKYIYSNMTLDDES